MTYLTDKQKAIYDYIYQYTLSSGHPPTQKEIGEHFQLKSLGSVQKYLKYLIDAGLLENNKNARRGIVLTSPPPKGDQCELPLLGKVAAGIPDFASTEDCDTINVPNHMVNSSGAFFALRVKGDSMIEAGILEGDTLVCKQVQEAKSGDIVVALHEDSATVKYLSKKGRHFSLLPANQDFSPIPLEDENWSITGLVTGLLRTF
jgi:repressor LexA